MNESYGEYRDLFASAREFRRIGIYNDTLIDPLLEKLSMKISERNPIQDFIDIHGFLNGHFKVAFVLAHGRFKGDEWMYIDGIAAAPVQELVDKLDGEYGAIYLLVDNRAHRMPKTSESLLVVPNGVIKPIKRSGDSFAINGNTYFSIVTPNRVIPESELERGIAQILKEVPLSNTK